MTFIGQYPQVKRAGVGGSKRLYPGQVTLNHVVRKNEVRRINRENMVSVFLDHFVTNLTRQKHLLTQSNLISYRWCSKLYVRLSQLSREHMTQFVSMSNKNNTNATWANSGQSISQCHAQGHKSLHQKASLRLTGTVRIIAHLIWSHLRLKDRAILSREGHHKATEHTWKPNANSRCLQALKEARLEIQLW